MLCGKTIAVVVPSYNEEKQIRQVLETMPDFVDRIIVVNDCSTDRTAAIILDNISKQQPSQTIIINNTVENNKNKYNRAENLLKEKQQADLKYFIPSEIANVHPESDRIILINNLKNGGVGRLSPVVINGVWITISTALPLWPATVRWTRQSWKIFACRF